MGKFARLFDTFNLTGIDTTSAPMTLPGSSSTSASEASSQAADKAASDNAAAVQSVKDAQTTASTQAQGALDAKRRAMSSSQSIYTSPLGLQTQAATSKKKLLGQ